MNNPYLDPSFIKELYSDPDRIRSRGSFLKQYSIRTNSVRERLRTLMGTPSQCHILDVGCGNGSFLKKIAHLYPDNQYYGLDIMRNKALDEFGEFLDYRVYDGENFPAYDTKFDILLCMNMLYHVDDHQKIFSWFKSVLKPTGSIFLTTKSIGNFSNFEKLVRRVLQRELPEEKPVFQPDEIAFSSENAASILMQSFPEDVFSIEQFNLCTKVETVDYTAVLEYMLSCLKYQKLKRVKAHLLDELHQNGLYKDQYEESIFCIQYLAS